MLRSHKKGGSGRRLLENPCAYRAQCSEYITLFGCSMNRSYAQLPMNRPLPDFCAFKLQLLLLPLHKAPVRSPAPKAFITGFIRLKLHSPLSMVQAKGVEPLILSAAASKTAMYPSSNTPGYIYQEYLPLFAPLLPS